MIFEYQSRVFNGAAENQKVVSVCTNKKKLDLSKSHFDCSWCNLEWKESRLWKGWEPRL